MQPYRILVVENEPSVCDEITTVLGGAGFSTKVVHDGESALEAVRNPVFEVAIMDLGLPGMSGIETSLELKRTTPTLEIILLSDLQTLEASHETQNRPFFDFLFKPIRPEILVNVVQQAIERRNLALENGKLISQIESGFMGQDKKTAREDELPNDSCFSTAIFVGESRDVLPIKQMVLHVAPTDVTVLVRGESGTGKEVIARLIHDLSGRNRTGDFVKINCPSIPDTLLESELFGHEAGAFTGASRKKPGRIEIAGNGTIFLDEIGDLSLSSQAKLLQILESKEYNRVGGTDLFKINARIIAATNAPLESMIATGRFRSDLFFRLNQFVIHLPPLRERTEDIPLLVDYFLSRCENKKVNGGISPSVLSKLVRYDWPGNVRELKSLVDRYVITGDECQILDLLHMNTDDSGAISSVNKIGEAEAELIQSVLIEERWNQRRAAQRLGIGYSALRRRIGKYKLKDRPVDCAPGFFPDS